MSFRFKLSNFILVLGWVETIIGKWNFSATEFNESNKLLKFIVYNTEYNKLIKIPYTLEEIIKIIFKIINNDTIYNDEDYKKWANQFASIN